MGAVGAILDDLVKTESKNFGAIHVLVPFVKFGDDPTNTFWVDFVDGDQWFESDKMIRKG